MKNKLVKVFGNFDREIYKITLPTYSARGGYEMARESFDNYVKKKKEQQSPGPKRRNRHSKMKFNHNFKYLYLY